MGAAGVVWLGAAEEYSTDGVELQLFALGMAEEVS